MAPEDERAFREFVTARSGALLRTAYLLTGDAGHAEDAVQAALTRVYLAWTRIRNRDAIEAYTRKAILREVMSCRRRRRVADIPTPTPPESMHEPSHVDAFGDRELLRAALTALPRQQRAAVVLRHYCDYSEAEVAELLGISVGAVKQHTARGLARLRTALGPEHSTKEMDR